MSIRGGLRSLTLGAVTVYLLWNKSQCFSNTLQCSGALGLGTSGLDGAAASALIYCNPGMPEQISDGVLSPASQAHLLLCQGHLPWRKEQTSGLGAAPSSLYVNKECFLSEIREQYVCRAGLRGAGQEDVKPCQLGGKPRVFPKAREISAFLPWTSIHSLTTLTTQSSSLLLPAQSCPYPRALWFPGDPSWASSFCRGLLAEAHPASFLPLQHLITPGSQSLWWV